VVFLNIDNINATEAIIEGGAMWSTIAKKTVDYWSKSIRTLTPKGECELCLQNAGGLFFLCDHCLQELPHTVFACSQCSEPMTSPGRCGRCQQKPPAFDYSYCPFLYQQPISLWIKSCKDSHQLIWLSRLTGLMERNQPGNLPQADAITFIPSSRRKLFNRGFNVTEIIARRLAKRLGIPLIPNALCKTSGNDQRGLSASQRHRNLRNSLQPGKQDLRGKHIVIIEDVMTTGATANAAASALKQQGAGIVGIWALARTPPPQWQHT